jgi:hypothetical protein
MTAAPAPDPTAEWQLMPPADAQDDRYRRGQEALTVVEQVRNRLSGIVRSLPPRLVERLGLDRHNRTSDWVALVFHLGWHFPAHGIEAGRYRILAAAKDAPWDFFCRELDLQLGGVRVSPDVYPGVMLSRLAESSDFLTASLNTLCLIQEALDGLERDACPEPSAEFARLHEAFSRQAELDARHPVGLSVKVLRLANSFRTPPATDWAGINRGGDGYGIPHIRVLSQLDADRVVCEVRGLGNETFLELADRAGALLPRWPTQQYPAVLSNVGAFVRFCDLDTYPWAVYSGDGWNRGMVTDHRGNVERWLGFMFAVLMAHRLEYFDLMTRPTEVPLATGLEPVNALLTLRGINPFAACARALELAELVPNRPRVQPQPTQIVPPQPLTDPEAKERPPMALQPLLYLEIEQLLADARKAYADRKLRFTLVAIPSDPTGGGRFQRCEEDSPDAGQIRDGVFYWPWRCVTPLGGGAIGDHGKFVLVAFYEDPEVMKKFSALGGQAAAALHAATPSWFGVRFPGEAITTWAAVIMFLSPSASQYSQQQPTGAYILRQPWAASITALNDILAPREAIPQDGQSPRPQPAPGGPASSTVDENELKVLDLLCVRHPVLMMNVDIETATDLSKQTVGTVLTGLIRKNLVERPRGKRKGATITAAGRTLVEGIRKSSADHP